MACICVSICSLLLCKGQIRKMVAKPDINNAAYLAALKKVREIEKNHEFNSKKDAMKDGKRDK